MAACRDGVSFPADFPQNLVKRFTSAYTAHSLLHMARPLIGITMDYGEQATQYMLPDDYATAVERAGGMPYCIPFRLDHALIPELVDHLAGILFSGGDDLDPSLYGETRHPKTSPLDSDRERFELALMAEVEKRRMPALGICLGSQLMNVYRGGSLKQFLPEVPREGALEHRRMGDTSRRHEVNIVPGTVLADTIGKSQIIANTRHKQAVDRLGRGLRITATAPDGIIEGIEDPSLPLFLAVQWHPENLWREPEHLAPFKLLVEKSRVAGKS
jgi:putative glutamine amidotransferase